MPAPLGRTAVAMEAMRGSVAHVPIKTFHFKSGGSSLAFIPGRPGASLRVVAQLAEPLGQRTGARESGGLRADTSWSVARRTPVPRRLDDHGPLVDVPIFDGRFVQSHRARDISEHSLGACQTSRAIRAVSLCLVSVIWQHKIARENQLCLITA